MKLSHDALEKINVLLRQKVRDLQLDNQVLLELWKKPEPEERLAARVEKLMTLSPATWKTELRLLVIDLRNGAF